MTALKTDKAPQELAMEGILAQLRHAYENLVRPGGTWDLKQRIDFANGLIAPQIKRLEEVDGSYTKLLHGERDKYFKAALDDLRQEKEHLLLKVQERLLTHAGQIASASQAKRIIISVIAKVRDEH